MTTDIALKRRLTDAVVEYNAKHAAIDDAVKAFEQAGKDLLAACTVAGVYGQERIETGSADSQRMKRNLLRSAWLHCYEFMQIERFASAKDKHAFEQSLSNLPPFTLENIAATFGKYYENPREHILRGLAEVFCGLDQAYKSHDRVRIGVKGLPKRVILSNLANSYGWGADKLRDILNALAQYQGHPLVGRYEIDALHKDGEALLKPQIYSLSYNGKVIECPARGVRLVRYQNGNGHLYFEPETLRAINLALAEYYGEVLPDCSEERPTQKQASTAVAKDLQYYPTPQAVVERVLDGYANWRGSSVLEPSCGCGRFLDALRAQGAEVVGIEYDAGRVEIARAKGHRVQHANFLEVLPNPIFDSVVMNPPFYGQHYAKHVEHALKFLKPGGRLVAILPATARYDHGLLTGKWQDLPVGSFSESGTNINTTVLTIFKEKQ